MESRVNYTLVGAFVLLLGAALGGVAFWLSKAGQLRSDYTVYQAYFDESVAGLNNNAPVRFRGVEVGRVRAISLTTDGRVRVIMRIDNTAPIKEDTRAYLRTQGLTGLVAIGLNGGTQASKPLEKKPGEAYPTIPTGPSLIARLDTAVSGLLENLTQTSENLNALTDADMRRSVKKVVDNLASLTQMLNEQKPAMEVALRQAGTTMERTAHAADEFAKLAQRLQTTAQVVDKMAVELSATARRTNAVVDETRHLVRDASGQTLPELNAAAAEMRELAVTLKRVGTELEQRPEMLLFGRGETTPGPGE